MRTNEILDVILMKNGDERAFERIYRRYCAKVYKFTSLFIIEDSAKEDIVQQVFIKLWEMRESLCEDKSIDGLLFIITRNITFNESHKSFDHEALKLVENFPDGDSFHDLQAKLEARQLETYIYELADQLPARQKEAFMYSRRDGLSYKEIAEIMQISEKGVERNIHMALKFLKANLPLFLLFCSVVEF